MLELRWSGKKEWDFFSSKLYLIVLLILFPLRFVLKKNLEKEIDNPAISLEFQWSKGMEEDPYRAVGPLIHLSSHTTSKNLSSWDPQWIQLKSFSKRMAYAIIFGHYYQ